MQRVTATKIIFLAIIALLCVPLTALADGHRVFVMPDGIVGGGINTAYALINESLDLFGDVRGGTPNYDWEWDAENDGTADYSGTVGGNDALGRSRIVQSHTYTVGGLKTAKLTVRDNSGAGSAVSMIVQINVLTVDDLKRRVNRAIHDGLHYMYRTQSSGGQWGSYPLANASLAALAFCNHGHHPPENNIDDGVSSDIYEATVIRALNYMFSRAIYHGTPVQPPGDPDTHPNAGGIYFNYNRYMYETGIVGLTLAGTQTPDRLVTNGTANGRTYKEVAGDLVDFLAYAQYDSGSRRGGWRYGINQAPDNSVAQWPAIGLRALEEEPTFQVSAPGWVKTQLASGWLPYSQNANGGFGYTAPWSWVNFAKTAAGIAEYVYALGPAFNPAAPAITNAKNFLSANWFNTGWAYSHFSAGGNWGDKYAMYALFKAAVDPDPDIQDFGANGANWRDQYNNLLVGFQEGDGAWRSPAYPWNTSRPHITTNLALLILAPGIAELRPVADPVAIPNPTPTESPVTLDGSGSEHKNTARSLVLFEWDFDYDGINFDVDATGEFVVHPGLPETGSNYSRTMALRVTDDSTPAMRDIGILIVDAQSGNVPPVSDPGGPYAAELGVPLMFDGTGSFDPNAGPPLNDSIFSYEWDLNANGVFGEPGETGPTPSWTYNAPGSFDIFLRVTDTFGLSGVASTQKTTLAVAEVRITDYSLAPGTGLSVTFAGGVFYLNMTLKVRMENVSAVADAFNITGDIFDKPPSHEVLDAPPHCTWPDLPAGAAADCADTLGLKINMVTNDPNNQDLLWEINYNSPNPGSPKTTVQNVPLSLP